MSDEFLKELEGNTISNTIVKPKKTRKRGSAYKVIDDEIRQIESQLMIFYGIPTKIGLKRFLYMKEKREVVGK